VALLGRLEEFQLQHIIGLLQVEKQTGELRLEWDGQCAVLYFQGGAIVHAVAGKETGYQAALAPFAWQQGTFHFEGGAPEIDPTITTTNATIVAAGLRLAEEVREAQARIPSMRLVPHRAHQVDGQDGRINLSFDEWRFLTLVDGRRDLHTIAVSLECQDFTVQLVANRLARNGLLELLVTTDHEQPIDERL
jgi:hypothetical protein